VGGAPLKIVHALSPHIAARHVTKCCGANPTTVEVIEVHLLHFKPIFDTPLNNVRGPVPGEGCASKTLSFSSACKNLGRSTPYGPGAKIWSFEKVDLGGYNFTSRSPRLLDRSSPDLFRLTREKSW